MTYFQILAQVCEGRKNILNFKDYACACQRDSIVVKERFKEISKSTKRLENCSL